MSDFITVPTLNHSFELVGTETFSTVEWPIRVQKVILVYFRFFINSPEQRAKHVSLRYTHGPASVGVRLPDRQPFQRASLPQPLGQSQPNLCGVFLVRGNKRLFPASGSRDQNGRHANKSSGKTPSKIFFA